MVNKGIKIIADFYTPSTAYYSACLNSPWTEWSAMAECIEGHITLSQASIYCVTQPAFTSPWTEWPAGLYRRTHNHIAGFDTYATAYYSACWRPVDWVVRKGVYLRPQYHYRRLRYACHGILLSLLYLPVDWVVRRGVSKATLPYRRLRYVCHGILLSLLVSNGQ